MFTEFGDNSKHKKETNKGHTLYNLEFCPKIVFY